MTSTSLVVGIEAPQFAGDRRGIGRYVRALLPRLVAQRPGLRLVLFVRRRDIAAVRLILAELPGVADRADVRSLGQLRSHPVDLAWYPWNFTGTLPRDAARVVTMQDVAPLTMPDPRFWKWRKNLRWRLRYRKAAREATLVLTISTFTASEVHRVLGLPHALLRVTLLAADDLVVPPADGDASALRRLGVRAPYVLAVGAADRRKNLGLLERAMPLVAARHPSMRLVLAGPRPTLTSDRDAPWRQTLGFVSDEDLVTLYRHATALLVPSTYEGFGLPVLEAMRLGTPVICSRASSLPEVGGDAAILVDPDDTLGMADAIVRLASEAEYVSSRRAASRRHEARFSWDETARLTLLAFEEAVTLHHGKSA